MFDKILRESDFSQGDDGFYYAVIPQTIHKFSGTVYVERLMKLTGSGTYENAICSYKFDATNGDLYIYASEPGSYKVTLNQVKN